MTAVMWIFAASGFWAGGSREAIPYPDIAACQADRVRMEVDRTARLGMIGVFTRCSEVKVPTQ